MNNSIKNAKYFAHGKEVRSTDLEVGVCYEAQGILVSNDSISSISGRYIGFGCFRNIKGKVYNTISEEKTKYLEEKLQEEKGLLNIATVVLIPKKGSKILYNANSLKTRSLFYLNNDMNEIIKDERRKRKNAEDEESLKKKKKLSYAQIIHLFRNEIVYLSDYKEVNFYRVEKDCLAVELVDKDGEVQVKRAFKIA